MEWSGWGFCKSKENTVKEINFKWVLKDWNNLGSSGTVETLFFKNRMFWAPLCTLKCMCVRAGVGELWALTWSFSCFFQDKARVPLLAGHPCPLFSSGPFPYDHREVWSPEIPTLAPLHPELGATSEVSSL